MKPAGTTVRVRSHVHATLRELSHELDVPIQDIIEDAIDAYRRQRMIEQHNRAYAAVKADPDQWRAELEERAGWGRSASDGLGQS